jgi:hypothetical protein
MTCIAQSIGQIIRESIPGDKQIVVINVDRANDVKTCLRRFSDTIKLVTDDTMVVRIAQVGLKIGGRPSRYDLYYIKLTNKMYAACAVTDQVFEITNMLRP